ncbi:hypothetical protein YTPLAS18_35510 [Nitrospira sp.]|nr:hypothetical protein YTPLAS18_35510 [Nitrospira sp.]
MNPRRTRFLNRCQLFLLGLLGVGLFALCTPSKVRADGATYADELAERARALQLADAPEWQDLLHYRRTLAGGYESLQDDPRFFMSPEGKTNPEAELGATLRAFFSQDLVGKSKQPAQCAFVARYHWLRDQLEFDDARLLPIPCPRFDRWFAEFDADGISMIFPAGFMNNPSSMFGHTFLRIDQRGQTPQTRILAYTINYAADMPPDAGIEYPIKGIFGGYKGLFSTVPYYLKVQEYRDIEHRDVWEYRLAFTPPQIRRLLMHAWELGNAEFDYYFFGENCSYHILSLLDVADPQLRLTDRFPFYTIPSDTVRVLMEIPGLVSEVSYRPSRSTVVRRKREAMSGEERAWLGRLIEQPVLGKDAEFEALPVKRQAFVLDTVSDYLLLRSDALGGKDNSWKQRNRAILGARSALKVRSPEFEIEPFTQRPDYGHGTQRVGVGAGWRNDQAFEEFNFRGAYHDLLDPDPGYTPDAQIELVNVAIRHYHNESQARIERFSPANVISLSPMDSLFHAPSWKISVGMDTIKYGGCALCSNGNLNGGMGAAFETRWLRREVFFAMAEVDANYSKAYEDNYRVGGGGTVGVLANVTERWKLLATTTYLKYPLGDHSDDVRWMVGQRYTISQNFVARMEYHHREHDNDVLFTFQAFY